VDLSAENAVLTAVFYFNKVYIERFLAAKRYILQPINWARIVVGGVILASKIWDDHAVWNIDFCQIFPDVKVSDLYLLLIRNNLEAFYLEAIGFNVNVGFSLYFEMYHRLKEYTSFVNLPWALFPLMRSQEKRLAVI
jgi:hypothetical protein